LHRLGNLSNRRGWAANNGHLLMLMDMNDIVSAHLAYRIPWKVTSSVLVQGQLVPNGI
jgi:hypothetical protein